MNRNSLARMRLDRRLMTRRGWIGAAELEHALAELPDVASKATTLGEIEEASGGRAKPEGPGETLPPAP